MGRRSSGSGSTSHRISTSNIRTSTGISNIRSAAAAAATCIAAAAAHKS